MSFSKSLKHPDVSGFEFVQDIMQGNPGAGINFDFLLYHPVQGYLLFELLLCEEIQPNVNPWTSHPRYYWHKNAMKFISLWNITQSLHGTLYLVNYAKKGTLHENKVKLMEVTGCTQQGITTTDICGSRDNFAVWFRNLNKEILTLT